MALATPIPSRAVGASVHRIPGNSRLSTTPRDARDAKVARYDSRFLFLLVTSGAATVIAGSYHTWATFYGGLIARNGVSGHGKYFIGLAAAAVLATLLSQARGVWPALRWLAVPVGLAIAAVALRDLRNLDALVRDPATGFYLPGRGDGLFIVIAGAAVIALAPFARPLSRARPTRVLPTLAALAAVVGAALLVPGAYGEYDLHLAHGHAHNHTEALKSAHALTATGLLLLVAATHTTLLGLLRRPRSAADG